ncbi:uncharacterized protein LOC129752865 [Uranotaenia lowii]|uniref:uncharacterized protein LOC129752865 n=1 Tax=Uranotaenia lowii TaxID=190385 RepID=UPI002478C130|nr:uncharacterized protein LOC129752865 [Uranotaenia lowii]
MGSPTSPILCDLVMEGLLRNCTKKLDFPVPLLIKYVDDLLLALPNNQLTHVLQTFNSYHPKMQFTMETAKNNSIAFLDTFITINEDRTLSTEWYSKDISSGRLLNYHSFHPISVKLNVARNFVKRSTTPNITTEQHPTDQHPTEQHPIEQHPIEQHPTQQQPAIIPPTQQQHKPNNEDHQSTAVEQQTQHHSESNLQTEQTTTESSINPLQIRYFPLTFIPNLSSHISKILKTDYAEIHIANCIPKPLGMLLPRAKDPIASSETPNIIYSIPCSSCPKQYIGMSRNNLKTRLVGHKSNIKKYEQLSTRDSTQTNTEKARMRENCTALLAHIIDEGHTMDLKKARVIDRTRRSSALPILKMCHIYTNTNTLNFKTDVNNLSSTYANILQCTTSRKQKTNVSNIAITRSKH